MSTCQYPATQLSSQRYILPFVLDKLGSSVLAVSKGLTLSSSNSLLKIASIPLTMLQELFVEWLEEMSINPAALPVRIDISTPALAAAVIEACVPLAHIMAMPSCGGLVRREKRLSQDGTGACSHLWYNYGKLNKYREAVKAVSKDDIKIVRRLAKRLPRPPSSLLGEGSADERSAMSEDENVVGGAADRFPDRLTLRGALDLPEVTSSTFAAFFVRHAWKANRDAFYKQLDDSFDVSSLPIDGLTISHNTPTAEKVARQEVWGRAFRSQQPPSVLEVHSEFTSATGRNCLADVTLVVPDGREVRVQQIPLSVLPTNKRSSSSSSIDVPLAALPRD